MLKTIKATLLLMYTLYFSIIAFGNITDYSSNWLYVQHILSMDSISSHHLQYRSIHAVWLQAFCYWVIILWECVISTLCLLGFWTLIKKNSINIALCGLWLALILYGIGFMVIANEWFAAWQSLHWNVGNKAIINTILILLSIIFLSHETKQS